MDGDAVEIPGAAGKARVCIRENPCIASVVGTIEDGLLGLNQRVDALAVGRNIDTDASPIAVWQAVGGHTRPGLAGILRAKEAAARSIHGRVSAPGRTMRTPRASK